MTVSDLIDGFAVTPDPKRARDMRMVVIAAVGTGIALPLILVALGFAQRQPALLVAGPGFLLLSAASGWVLWRTLRPPVLKADSTSVTYVALFKTTRVPRAELAMIFQGQTYTGGRAAAWVRGYLFTVAGGKVSFAVPEVWFASEDLAEFARRLGLPLRGDFSQRVRDTVNEGD